MVEDGTGLPDAEMYDEAADCAAWLFTRGMELFASLTESEQWIGLLAATELAESEVRGRVDGFPLAAGQALVFPRLDWTDRNGECGPSIPSYYRHGIFILAERWVADGKRLTWGDPDDGILLRKTDLVTTGLQWDSKRGFSVQYPRAFRLIRRCFKTSRRMRNYW